MKLCKCGLGQVDALDGVCLMMTFNQFFLLLEEEKLQTFWIEQI